jgi:Tol biopolymer transport system component
MNRAAPLCVLATVAGCGPAPGTQPVGFHPNQQIEPQIQVTGAGQALARVTSDPVDEDKPRLSPDGRTLLFHTYTQQQQTSGFGTAASTDNAHFAIAGVDPATGARRTLYTSPNTSAAYPAWMPDGSTFVYMTDAVGSQSIVRALSSAPNSGMAIVVSGTVAPQPSNPSVSPDGRRVAFEAQIGGSSQVSVAGLDGSNLTILGAGKHPAWDPGGQRLAFVREVNGFDQLFTIDAESGTGLTQLTSDQLHHAWPCWSPDGRYLVFSTHHGNAWRLYAITPNGTGLIQLTEGQSSAASPHWGRDGFIYFSSNALGNWDIWRFQPVGELAPAPPIIPPETTEGT